MSGDESDQMSHSGDVRVPVTWEELRAFALGETPPTPGPDPADVDAARTHLAQRPDDLEVFW